MSSSSQTESPQQEQTVRLAHRPEAKTYAVEELLRLVASGRVRVPSFQRELRWKKEHIEELLDSIYCGYPIGTLLFWKKFAPAQTLAVGPVTIAAPERQDAFWVVDGQQRITTLVGVLSGTHDDDTADHALFFDLMAAKFVRATRRSRPQSNWLPLNQVVDSARLLKWLHTHAQTLQEQQIDLAVTLGKSIREYQIPVYIVETDDEAPLRAIFDRTNTGGQPLKRADVFKALHEVGPHKPGGLGEVAQALAETGFGQLDRELILTAMLAVLDKDPLRDFKDQIASDDVVRGLDTVQAALMRALQFLRQDADIPHIKLLPYRLTLVTLARFFHRHPSPSPRLRDLLSRWVWRGTLGTQYEGNNSIITSKFLRPMDRDAAEGVQHLLSSVDSQAPLSMPPLCPFSNRFAHSRAQLIALWTLRPRHLQSGTILQLADIMNEDIQSTQIKQRSNNDPESARGLSNRLLHPSIKGGLRRPLIKQSDPAILQSHGVPPEAHEALRRSDFAEFLRAREEHLKPLLNQFLNAHAQWEASDRSPLADLIIDDDD